MAPSLHLPLYSCLQSVNLYRCSESIYILENICMELDRHSLLQSKRISLSQINSYLLVNRDLKRNNSPVYPANVNLLNYLGKSQEFQLFHASSYSLL